jgi:hypothetical protein
MFEIESVATESGLGDTAPIATQKCVVAQDTLVTVPPPTGGTCRVHLLPFHVAAIACPLGTYGPTAMHQVDRRHDTAASPPEDSLGWGGAFCCTQPLAAAAGGVATVVEKPATMARLDRATTKSRTVPPPPGRVMAASSQNS